MDERPEEWTVVRTFADLKEAEVACALVRSEGIPCFLQGAEHRSMLGFLGAYIQPRLMVPPDSVDRVQDLLEPVDGQSDDVPEADSKEAADLDVLIMNFSELTLFTLGAGARRAELEKLVGPPTTDVADDEGGRELRFGELGAIVFVDGDRRICGFVVVAHPTPKDPDLAEFQGFWEPGGMLRPPTRDELVAALGTPAHEEERPGGALHVVWDSDRAAVYATLVKGFVTELEVSFASPPETGAR